MLIGADTGLMVKIFQGEEQALKIFEAVKDCHSTVLISVVSINELLYFAYKRGKGKETEKLIALFSILPGIEIKEVTPEIAKISAGYRYSLAIPTIDSIILATFLKAKCDLIVSTDKHFRIAQSKKLTKVKII